MQHEYVLWMVFSLILIIFCVSLLAILCINIYKREKRQCFLLGAIGSGFYVIRSIIILLMAIYKYNLYLFIFENISFVMASIMILWAMYKFINMKLSLYWLLLISGALVLFFYLVGQGSYSSQTIIFPVYVFQGVAYLRIGMGLRESEELEGIGRYIIVSASFLWALYLICFPVTSVMWSAPLHFFLYVLISFSFVLGVFLIFIDKMKESLYISEKRSQLLIESFPYGVFVTKLDDTICFVNSAGLTLLGVNTAGLVLGKSVKSFLFPDYFKDGMRLIEDLRKSSNCIPLQKTSLTRIDGSTINVETLSIPFVYDNEISVLTVARDINKEKQVDLLQKKCDEQYKMLNETLEIDKLKTDFFANLSHELRTPLNIIFSTLQLFELYERNSNRAAVEKNHKKMIDVIKQNCYRLLRLVNNLIDSTKIDSGFLEMQLQSCNIVGIIEDITLSAAEYIKAKGIKLVFDTDVEEKVIECDPDKIERVMLNLLSNAIKYTGPGGAITVTVQDNEKAVVVAVKDTGIGIPEDKRGVIFERFRQADSSLTREIQGSGIGLSLVKSIVEMHNGSVWVDSELGKGSTFIVELPVGNGCSNDSMLSRKYTEENRYSEYVERMNIEFSDIYSREKVYD
ncbi:MAG: PAS domain-containing sensor histidine kinase [Clostridia bacterium]|nr:PAS domain-containing sensor histidine kinase [Clostridia bacterium]